MLSAVLFTGICSLRTLCPFHRLNPSHASYLLAYEDGTDSVPKHWYLNYRCQWITQKKVYNHIFSVLNSLVGHFLLWLMQFAKVHKCMLVTTFIWPHCKQWKCWCVCKFITVICKHFNESGIQVGSIWYTLQNCKIFNYTLKKYYNVNFNCILLFCAHDYFLFLFSTGYSSRLLKFLSWRTWTYKMHILS
jgi:hypothetical protein